MKKIIILIPIYFFSLTCFPQSKSFNLSKGKDASSKQEYNLALMYFNQVLLEDPICIEALNERAHTYNMLGDYKKAIEDYKFVISKDPNNAEAYFGLGNISETWLDDKYNAVQQFTKAIEISLDKGDNDYAGTCYLMRGAIKDKLGDKLGSIDDFKKGAALGNTWCKSLLELNEKIHK